MTYWNAIFKEWQEMQQRFIENLPMKLPGIEYPTQSMNPWELPHLKTFMSWGQSAVRQSLELQTHWLEQWANQMSRTITSSNDTKSEMVERIQESMKGWSQNQSELWEYWFKMVEETANSMEDPSALFENISSWKETVEESLATQSDWLRKWRKEINIEELSPDELLKVSTKIQEIMNGWLELQGELWHQWFDFLSLNEIVSIENSVRPKSTKEKSVPRKSTEQKKPKPKKERLQDKDDLERISGIGPTLAKKLYEQGITSFKQIAELTEKQIEELEETIIKFPGRIRREDWINQAKRFLDETPGF